MLTCNEKDNRALGNIQAKRFRSNLFARRFPNFFVYQKNHFETPIFLICPLYIKGCIHEVRSRSILLMFDPKFHDLYCGEVYDVEFHFSRGQFRHGLLYIYWKNLLFFVTIICGLWKFGKIKDFDFECRWDLQSG